MRNLPTELMFEDINRRLRELIAELAICPPMYRERIEKLIAETEYTRDFFVVSHKREHHATDKQRSSKHHRQVVSA